MAAITPGDQPVLIPASTLKGSTYDTGWTLSRGEWVLGSDEARSLEQP